MDFFNEPDVNLNNLIFYKTIQFKLLLLQKIYFYEWIKIHHLPVEYFERVILVNLKEQIEFIQCRLDLLEEMNEEIQCSYADNLGFSIDFYPSLIMDSLNNQLDNLEKELAFLFEFSTEVMRRNVSRLGLEKAIDLQTKYPYQLNADDKINLIKQQIELAISEFNP